ncbi:MAG: 4-hydroxy-tetrahydrodipicolinate synthase [Bacteroidales bacterium]|jgi:4-hydroxy-tetrahydrodipicolinate synthase|nr:4-hydroxy-tetrahydrodipicolinate synthase [Bacteroidales bacterium]
MKKFRGTGVAIVTPFKNDSSVDFSSLGKVINHVIEGGVSYIVALGTTGEAPTISKAEKQAIISYAIEAVNNRVPLVIGIGGNNTQEITNFIKNTDLNGVEAILSVSPYYNKPTQRGIYMHYKAVAASSNLPVIMYNVPSRTGSNMSAETCVQLARECDNIIAVKEASGDFTQIMKILRDKPDEFLVISGDDMNALPVIAAGGSGLISVLANAFPTAWSEMVGQALKTNMKAAREIQYRYLELIELLFVDGSPAGIKAMLQIKGLCQNYLRLPLVPVSKPVLARIQKAVDEIS